FPYLLLPREFSSDIEEENAMESVKGYGLMDRDENFHRDEGGDNAGALLRDAKRFVKAPFVVTPFPMV
ncbi:hypothetical protein NPIL_26441, partial [Nephila pilipes]